jgi:Pvc16 N-terminal domain
MIYEALNSITEEINEYFKSKLKIPEEKIVLSGLVTQDGKVAIQGENKIIVTLVNLEKETARGSNLKTGESFNNSAPSLNINIYILFSAYFSERNYHESLRFISFIISYFQYKSVFNKSNTPNLDERIEKLIFEITDLNPDALSNMWSTLGAKYMPSVLYKVRMLSFDESVIREFRPLISKLTKDSDIIN